jgi:superoxide dismutase, Cu-Zn family
MRSAAIVGLGVLWAFGTGCGTTGGYDAGNTDKASAAINETGGAQGTASFEDSASGLKVKVTLTAVPTDGQKGMHLHATGDCGNSTLSDGGVTAHGAAGGHWNPGDAGHACPPTDPRHAGDLGNITVASGAGTLELTLAGVKVSDVVGKAIILHGAADDCTTQPTGNSGGRIGCAVIAR